MRVHVDKTNLLTVALISFVLGTFVLSYLSRTLSPDQVTALLARLPGQATVEEFDHTVKLPNGYKLSTKSNSEQFVLLTKKGEEVETDLAALDISFATQSFRYPNNLDFPSEDKPRHIVIRLVDEPQPWHSLFNPDTNSEIGSLNVVADTDSVEVSIFLAPQDSLELSSQLANKFTLYALYALTHAWPSDSAQMMSHVNEQIVNYYGHGQHEPTFYVK